MSHRFTLEQIEEAAEDQGGFCLACGEPAYGVEPDARGYECEECGKHQVYGAEEIAIMGAGRLMATRVASTQYALDGSPVTRTRFRFAPGEYDSLRELAEAHRMECEFHYDHLSDHKGPRVLYLRPDREYKWGPNSAPIFRLYYDDPWEPIGNGKYSDVICQWCHDYGLAHEYDFGPEWCERGSHDVIQRNPRNGWRGYIVNDPEADDNDFDPCCVGCAQRYYKEHGHTREQMAPGRRVACDFYSYDELVDLGFTEGESFFGGRRDDDELERYHAYCLDLIEQGYICLTDQGATGIGFGPDNVTVYYRKGE